MVHEEMFLSFFHSKGFQNLGKQGEIEKKKRRKNRQALGLAVSRVKSPVMEEGNQIVLAEPFPKDRPRVIRDPKALDEFLAILAANAGA